MNLQEKALTVAAVLALSGCGGGAGTQDVPSQGSDDTEANGVHTREFHARAIDGYLAGATAYVDLNANGQLDAFEPRAVTDRDGFFSYNHLTATDYCAADVAELAQHCLRGVLEGEQALIRVTGGYDTITGLPFVGTLSLRSGNLARSDRSLVTPQTSMVATTSSAASPLVVLANAGVLVATSTNDDHIGGLMTAESVRAQLATFLVRMFALAAEQAGAGSFEKSQADAWDAGYLAMATRLQTAQAAGQAGAFGASFSSADVLRDLVRYMVHARQHPGQAVPANYVLPDEPAMTPMLHFSADLVALGEELIEAMQVGAVTPEHLKASLRALALAAERGLNDPADAEIADLFAWVRNQIASSGSIGADLAGLGADNVDLNVLIDRRFDFVPASTSISASAIVPEAAATAFSAVANTAFRGSVRRATEQGDALVYVSGQAGARSGPLQLCIRYRDSSGDFDTGTAADPDGALLVQGHWSLVDDHTLTLNVDIVGGVRPLIVKSVGVSGSDLMYRFDYGGDLSEWTGAAPAAFGAGSVPADDAACKAALIEEFGATE
jgi:hypothetical protein